MKNIDEELKEIELRIAKLELKKLEDEKKDREDKEDSKFSMGLTIILVLFIFALCGWWRTL